MRGFLGITGVSMSQRKRAHIHFVGSKKEESPDPLARTLRTVNKGKDG